MDIKALREQKGITQAKLSMLVGVSKVTIQNWENTNAKPSAENLAKLEKVLGEVGNG